MRARYLPPAWFAVVAAIAILTACSSAPNHPATTTASSSSGGASAAIADILDFTAPRLGGGAVAGADYAGKDTALWFWAPW